MPIIKITFPAGRYHATPWGHHVNEGQIEWPPSPWRLLRALIACGYSTQQWTEVPCVGRSLFLKLASVLPKYRLPAATAAHSRHFMPIGLLEKGREKTTLVFDTWASVVADDLVVSWECDLSDEEHELFSRLVECLGYLGRSESFIEATTLDERDLRSIEFNAIPHYPGLLCGRGWEQVTTMAAIPNDDYVGWRDSIVDSLLREFPLPEGKKKPSTKLLKDRSKLIQPYPMDIIDCLQKDTSWWKQQRWNQPPGSQRVVYWRRSNSLQVSAPRRANRTRLDPVTTLLLAMTSPSGRKSALPSVTRTLPQAELLHRALVGRVGKGQSIDCPELTGKDSEGSPLSGKHMHAHIIPLDLDNDKHLDHILLHAPMGFGDDAQHAIKTIRRTWSKGGVGEIQLALAGCGDLQSLRSLSGVFAKSISDLLGPPEGSKKWRSHTPFVPPRFVKQKGKNSITGQIQSELASRGFPYAQSVEIVPWSEENLHLRHYVSLRRTVLPPVNVSFAILIEFPQLLRPDRPVTLGYGSHFGLGCFHSVGS